jgi:hypothetical protein
MGNIKEIEVSSPRHSTNDSVLIQCVDSSLEITEISYGHKPSDDLNDKDYCYAPQWYTNERKCINDVSNTTL